MWTDKTIAKAIRDAQTAEADVWLTDGGRVRGEGRLRLRARPNGRVGFYFRYVTAAGKQAQLALGSYDSTGIAGLTLKAARAKAGELSQLYQAGTRDLHALLAHRQAEEAAVREAANRAREEEARQGTFGDLLLAYADMLEKAGKASAKAVRNQVLKDVKSASPHLWTKPAKAISTDDCLAIVGKLEDAGTLRQADKLRSYIKSAFRAAINRRIDRERRFGIASNPASDIDKVSGSSNASERALSVAEFRAYWVRVQALEEPRRSVAMLHVLTGGQRMQQLARVTLADVDRDAMLMRLRDGKGRREKPREYWVPLLPEALACVDRLTPEGGFVFSANGGVSPMHTSYISDVAKEVCTAMAEAGELQGAPFTGKAIRATVETRLMKKPYRVSSDVLARLLSHGLGGVQAKHYAHDAMHEEMAEALAKLWRLLNDAPEPVADVIPLRRA
ncbi:tyrosine-type recombinase/integrase [Pseudomonas indica]|uniref:tyrosine-type recombinase/integrase n=1 Tax=Pseudomonas indica TaxID=137658 RepID=UPI0023F6722A|nr:integrase family protein [Pseudomonas indica]MBU3055839.1 integrase family protein [Pseudomonas indica]